MESNFKVKLDIVSGFLGAGKTTFIQKLIHDVFDKENVVVLENEFGKISLDGETLERQGIAVESVLAGCICCTSAGEFTQNIILIADKYYPGRIVIEPTGLARLSDIRERLGEPSISDRYEVEHVVTIVDAKNFHSRMMISKDFFEDQIKNNKVIFLSKTEELEQCRIDEVVQLIKAINPDCTVITQPWQQITANQLKTFLGKNPSVLPEEKHVHEEHHHSHGKFESFSYEADVPVEQAKIRSFLKEISEGAYGEVLRVKGVFQDSNTRWFRFEYVPGEMQVVPITQKMPLNSKKLQACVIGTGLKKDLLQEKIA